MDYDFDRDNERERRGCVVPKKGELVAPRRDKERRSWGAPSGGAHNSQNGIALGHGEPFIRCFIGPILCTPRICTSVSLFDVFVFSLPASLQQS